MRVDSVLIKRIQTQDLRKSLNIKLILNLSGDIAHCPVSYPEIKLWQQRSKNIQSRYQTFFVLPVLLDFPVLFQIASPGLSEQANFLKLLQKASTVTYWSFFDRTNVFESYERFFQRLESLLKVQREKEKLSDDFSHIILELDNVLIHT